MDALLQRFVADFAQHVQGQTEAVWRGDPRGANKRAQKRLAAFDKLCVHGDAGRDALATLFSHPRMDVRVAAAAFLSRHRTEEAKSVLRERAGGV